MQRTIFSPWFARRLAWLIVAAVIFACTLSAVLVNAASGDDQASWASPSDVAIRKVGPLPDARKTPGIFGNLDCSVITYRKVDSSDMRQGCFTETGFGMMGGDTVIFNGTDEGITLEPYTNMQSLEPWPNTMSLLSFTPVVTDGLYVSLYKNVLTSIKDGTSAYGDPVKQLIRGPDVRLRDPSGAPLVINPGTTAFSANGDWMVAETMNNAFVRVNLSDLSVMAFAPSFASPGGPWMHASYDAVSEDGKFVATYNKQADSILVYDLRNCGGKVDGLKPLDCKRHDYMDFAKQNIAGLSNIVRLRFINENLLGFGAASSGEDSGMYELSPSGPITSMTNYIALGDSYTSGEGAFDYLLGTDTQNNMCHLSRRSYPMLLTQDLFGEAGGHSVACSGAVIKDVGDTSAGYHGQARGAVSLQQLQHSNPILLESIESGFPPGYVAQQRFIKRWQPSVATVSVGGNDIGFGNILQNCVEPHISRHRKSNTCYNTYEDRLELTRLIDRTEPRLEALYTQLHSEAPETQLYAIGYPQIAVANGDCALNVQLNKSELELASGLIDYLNYAVKKAAVAAGVTYIDISRALAGHRLCEATGRDVAVNGLTAGTDAGALGMRVLGKESYHPNALGHALIEHAILGQIRNSGKGSQEPDSGEAHPPAGLLDAPKTGRQVYVFTPDSNLSTGVGMRGLSIPVHANSGSLGLTPATSFVHLDGPSGPVIGDLNENGSGDLSGSIKLPDDATTGGHTIDLTGKSETGEMMDVSQPFYIEGSSADNDGDGIDDITDTCPGIMNSGQDSDSDGTDDICDPIIGTLADPTYGSPRRIDPDTQPGTTRKASARSRAHVLGATAYRTTQSGKTAKSASEAIGKDSNFHHGKSKSRHLLAWSCLVVSSVFIGSGVAARKFTKKKGFQLQ